MKTKPVSQFFHLIFIPIDYLRGAPEPIELEALEVEDHRHHVSHES
jgi:hypothetical protein